jgi:hypothetical protein
VSFCFPSLHVIKSKKLKYIYKKKELWKRMKGKCLNPSPGSKFAKFRVRVLVLK